MRKLLVAVTLIAVVGLFVGLTAAAGGAASKPKGVNISGKVNAKGSTDVSASASATLAVTETDFAISPTFIKVKAGQTLDIDVENTGQNQHTFTSKKLRVNERLEPGQSAQLTVTVPKKAGTVEFFCSLHKSMGMRGAVYTGAKGTSGGAKSSSNDSGTSSGGYEDGY